jgi:hypothetical protein
MQRFTAVHVYVRLIVMERKHRTVHRAGCGRKIRTFVSSDDDVTTWSTRGPNCGCGETWPPPPSPVRAPPHLLPDIRPIHSFPGIDGRPSVSMAGLICGRLSFRRRHPPIPPLTCIRSLACAPCPFFSPPSLELPLSCVQTVLIRHR